MKLWLKLVTVKRDSDLCTSVDGCSTLVLKMTIRGTIVRSEVCNAVRFCLESYIDIDTWHHHHHHHMHHHIHHLMHHHINMHHMHNMHHIYHASCIMHHVSCFMCHVSCVMCDVSCVICYLSCLISFNFSFCVI